MSALGPGGAGRFYTLAAARRGLLQFAAGKLASAVLGISFLLLTVRALEPQAYGRYVALMAAVELFYLVTGLGLSTVAQRYVAEYRLRAPAGEFAAFLRTQFGRRLAYSVVGAVLLALGWQPFMALSGLGFGYEWLVPMLLLMVSAAGVSYLEEVQGACLLQGYSQGLAVARNLVRVGAVVAWSHLGGGLSLWQLLWTEALVSLASWLVAEALVRGWARRMPSAPGAVAGYHAVAMQPVARRFYLVQLLGQSYGTNVVKLLVLRLLGATQAAGYGVAQSVVDMVRNYLPAHLLAGWVRPLMVARYVQHHNLDEVCQLANLVLKLNLLALLPLAALCAALGNEVGGWVSGGRYATLGPLLTVLVLALVMHTAHLLLTMVALTLEAPAANLRATVAAAATLPLVVLLVLHGGVLGAAAAIVLSELVWVGTAAWLLRASGHRIWLDAAGVGRITACAVVAGTAAVALRWHGHHALVALAVLGLVYLGLLAWLRPATAREIDMVRRLLKRTPAQ